MPAPEDQGVFRGWLNELVLVPGLTLLFWLPFALAVVLAGRFLHPVFGHTEPLGAAVLITSLLGAYAFAVYRVRGRHRRIHGRYP